MRRVDVNEVRRFVESLSEDQLRRQNESDTARAKAEYQQFIEEYEKGTCYLCGKPLKTLSKSRPCVHWLLRECKFKKKDFPLVYNVFGYVQIAAYLRWVANAERFLSSINDLEDERQEKKVFEFTIKWRNIEWTFDCSKNDYAGHGGTNSDYPHYHMQMRIDSQQFINFGDFHIPFSEEDLFRLDLSLEAPESFCHTFGGGGAGMQSASEIEPEDIVEETVRTDNRDEATYRIQTLIQAGDNPIQGEALQKMFEESERTGATFASLARKYLTDASSIRTIVSPAESVPVIARRTPRRRR